MAKTDKDILPDKEKWEFDQSVTDCFEDMLKRSIPMYDEMRRLTFLFGKKYVQPNTVIMDLGTSRGDAIYPFVFYFGEANEYMAVEVSEPMREYVSKRFLRERMNGYMDIVPYDLRKDFPKTRNASLVLCVLTLQFIPIEYRQKILKQIFASLQRGGALIIVEKVLGEGTHIEDKMIDVYHDFKEMNGYSREEINRKRLQLEGVLVPLTAKMNEDMFRKAGFNEVDCFYRWGNFAGWICVKERRE